MSFFFKKCQFFSPNAPHRVEKETSEASSLQLEGAFPSPPIESREKEKEAVNTRERSPTVGDKGGRRVFSANGKLKGRHRPIEWRRDKNARESNTLSLTTTTTTRISPKKQHGVEEQQSARACASVSDHRTTMGFCRLYL